MNDWRMYTDATGTETNHTAWHEVLKEIAQLNGTTHTLVHAAFGDHVDLVVAGGNNGKVLLQWKEYEPMLQHFILARGEANGLMNTLTIEGNETPFPAEWCLALDAVIPVCGDLLRSLEMKSYEGLQWIEITE
ncbi:hypothetical protein [Brevibacillus fulvus]|uniref:Uncharacterized protein n=1 Tax=Brevibacillus fulvus TaxID=1125967 RepID=A0A938Y3W0_9BACL|nr:hypothetical protein [Brevibacillus fulvus]MBM7590740.1 hypothetical protein [Brevibacillus fulvus]